MPALRAFVGRTGAFTTPVLSPAFLSSAANRSDFRSSRPVKHPRRITPFRAEHTAVSCSTVLLRRSILAGQRFPTEYYHEDYVFWLELLKAGYRAIACTEVLADYRLVKGSRSSDKRNAAKNRWLIYRRVEKLSIWKSAAVFAVYACHALRKHRRAR